MSSRAGFTALDSWCSPRLHLCKTGGLHHFRASLSSSPLKVVTLLRIMGDPCRENFLDETASSHSLVSLCLDKEAKTAFGPELLSLLLKHLQKGFVRACCSPVGGCIQSSVLDRKDVC